MSRRPVRLPATAGDRAVRRALAVCVLLALAGCSLDQWAPRTYEPPLQQGNVIDPEAVARLKPGMTRSQVRFVLGTPMVVDVFRNDRWDYVYLHRRQGEPTRQRRLAVFFDGDLLARVETDGVASAPGVGAAPASAAPAAAAGGVGAARAAPASPTPPAGAGAAAGSPASRGAVAPAGGPGAAAPPTSAAAGSGTAPSVTGAAGAPATASGTPGTRGAPATAPGLTGAGGAPAEPPAAEAAPAPARGFFGRMLERIGL